MRSVAFATGLLLAGVTCAGAAHALTLTSPDIKPGARISDEQVANIMGCPGKDISPALKLVRSAQGDQELRGERLRSGCADGQRLLALGCDRHSTERDVLAEEWRAILRRTCFRCCESRTDIGSPGYSGPCPPKGDKPHHYHFQLFAVDVDKLDADENATPAYVGFNLHFHTLAKLATLIGVWSR